MGERIGNADGWRDSLKSGRKMVSDELNVANAFSVAKPLLVMAANKSGVESPLYKPLIAASFAADIFDGRIARKFGSSPQGGVVDVITGHATEALIYRHLSDEGIIPKWVPPVTLVRNVVTDIVRETHVITDSPEIQDSNSVLQLNESSIAKKIVASRAMRLGYGVLKASVALSADQNPDLSRNLSKVAVGVSMARGLPVVLNKGNYRMLMQSKERVE